RMDDVLAAVGLGPDDQAVYEALIEGPATLAHLEQVSPFESSRLVAALDRLEKAGLVGCLAGAPVRYAAAAPEVALEALLLRRAGRSPRARRHAQQLATRHRRAFPGEAPARLVEVVTGRVAALQRFEHVQRSARREVRAIDKPPYATPSGNRNPVEGDLLGRGVQYRVIYDPGGLEDYHDLRADLEKSTALGEQARVLPGAPTKLILADDRVGLIPLQAAPSTIESIVVVHPSALLEALGALFESLWARALPLPLRWDEVVSDDGPTTDEMRLLALLVTGVPDVVIARQLGLSYRTFQRRLRELMGRLGAETRFQAGIRAVQLGWVPREDG